MAERCEERTIILSSHDISVVTEPNLEEILLNLALYFGLGFLAFKLLENVARDRGLLGHY